MLIDYLKAGYPTLCVLTNEPHRAERILPVESHWRFFSWNCVTGLTQAGSMKVLDDIRDPLDALRWIDTQTDTVLMMHNLHLFTDSPEVIQALINGTQNWKRRGNCVIMLSPVIPMRPELNSVFTLLELPLPTADELFTIQSELGAPLHIRPNKKCARLARGLTDFEAECAFAYSLVQKKYFSSRIVSNLKSQLIKKSGLLEIWEPDHISRVGGLSALKSFITNRAKAFMPGNEHLPKPRGILLAGPPGTGKSLCCKATASILGWRHLLAWLMRDQKCIQDNFWDWRTPDSESGSPQHRSRKKESEHLVRAVLGLLAREENKLRENLAELQVSLKRAEAVASEAAILPELHKAMALRQLRNHSLLLSVKENEPLPEMAFAMHLAKEESRIHALEEEYNNLRAELAAAEQNQKYWESIRERQQALLAPHKGYLDGLRPPKAEDPKLAAIKEVADRECPAAILYKDCKDVQKVWNALEQKSRGVDLASVMSEKEYQHVITIIAGLERTLREAQENKTKAGEAGTELKDKKIPTVYKELMAAYRRLDAQKTQWDILKEAWSILLLNAPNTELQLATQAVEKFEEEQGNIEMALSIARQENIEKAAMVAARFDGLVKNVIGAKSVGKFLAGDDISFSVSAKGAVGGDAMKVLQTILGDFASMLYAIDGAGTHPGVLVHDSPRQADMSRAWYWRFLTYAAEVSESAGGKDDAPFQYIITTTTAPPESLQPYVRKEFASIPPEKLLFKKRLTPLQAELGE